MNRQATIPALAAILLAGSAAIAAEPQVRALGCDSLLVEGSSPGWEWLELDQGKGFERLAALAAPGGYRLRLAAPGPGRTLALRAARLDSLGLPEYDGEWVHLQALPVLNARLEDGRLKGRLANGGDCPLPDLVLRLALAGRVQDVLRVPGGSSFELDLRGRSFDQLTLAWSGQPPVVSLANPAAPAVEPAWAGPPADSIQAPPAPEWAGLDGARVLLASPWPPRVLAGSGSLAPADSAGLWWLTPTPGEEALVVAVDGDGRFSLPFRWEDGGAEAPTVERTGPGSLLVRAAEGAPELVWLDGAGRQGRFRPDERGTRLEGLCGRVRLQTVEARGGSGWRREIDLGWAAPKELLLSTPGDSVLLAELVDERGWSPVWELEWRTDERPRRLAAAPVHRLPLAAGDRLFLRWRAGTAPSQSRWSPWREVRLVPRIPQGVGWMPTRQGIRLEWAAEQWLAGRVEVERVVDGDTTRTLLPANAVHWLDAPSGDRLASYRLRRVLAGRAGEWTAPLHAALPGASRRTRVGHGELRAWSAASGVPLPSPADWVEGLAGLPRDDRPARGISPREAMAYCDWLNAALGFGGRYDAAGGWSPGADGGYRLPRDGHEAAELAGEGRIWLVDGARIHAAGSDATRGASGKRPYDLDARQPDVGIGLLFQAR